MNVAFASNYLNVHQRPFCEAMIERVGTDGFKFIATTPFNSRRLSSGYEDMNNAPFVIRAYEDQKAAQDAVLSADVMVGMPYAYPDYIRMRLDEVGKLTFAYSERLLKRGLWASLVPKKHERVHDAFTVHRANETFHVLCASAFTSFDLSIFGFPAERCWKWGYFPALSPYCERTDRCDGPVEIIWVGRIIDWKRPFMPLRLARKLVLEGYDFHLTMVGEGEMRGALEDYIRTQGLEGFVTMAGSVPNAEVHRLMACSDILLFTSNRQEGWGAVLNEAMSNGCAPVASSQIGSVPYLLEDGKSGLVFRDGDFRDMYRCVTTLLNDRDLMMRIGKNARDRIASLWNADTAATAFLDLSKALLSGERPQILEGPCSPAGIVKDSWLETHDLHTRLRDGGA